MDIKRGEKIQRGEKIMAGRRKSEWKETQKEREQETDREKMESEDILRDGEEAVSDWGEQPEPSLIDTAEALNAIAKELATDISETHSRQAGVVDTAIEGQRQDVSEPARESERTERGGADALDAASARGGRFASSLSEGSEQRKDAADFLNEIASEDEEHQDHSKDDLERHRQTVQEAIRRIEEF